MADLKGMVAILLGLPEFFDDIPPAAASYTGAVAAPKADKVRFALNEAYRKAMDRESVLEYLQQRTGNEFDGPCVAALQKWIPNYEKFRKAGAR